MTRFFALICLALLTFGIIFYIKRPDIAHNFWIWCIGIAVPVIGIVKKTHERIREKIETLKEQTSKQNN